MVSRLQLLAAILVVVGVALPCDAIIRTSNDICNDFGTSCYECARAKSSYGSVLSPLLNGLLGYPTCSYCGDGTRGCIASNSICGTTKIDDTSNCPTRLDECHTFTSPSTCVTFTGCGWCGDQFDGTGSCSTGSATGPINYICPAETGGWRFGSDAQTTWDYRIAAGSIDNTFSVNGGVESATGTYLVEGGTTIWIRILSLSTHPLQLRNPNGVSLTTLSAGITIEPYDSGLNGVVSGYMIYKVPTYLQQSQNFGGRTYFTINSALHSTMVLRFDIKNPASGTGTGSTTPPLTSSTSNDLITVLSSSTGTSLDDDDTTTEMSGAVASLTGASIDITMVTSCIIGVIIMFSIMMTL